jgi:hypothetical protein
VILRGIHFLKQKEIWVRFRNGQPTATVNPLNIGIIELAPYEDDVEMTEEQEEDLLRVSAEEVMTGNPFMGDPTPQQQEFLEALNEGAQ